MQLIPGLELRKGHVAVPKPVHDKKEDPLQYLDPFETAAYFIEAGAQRLHIIDADGALEGEPVNLDVVQELHKRHPSVQIEVTGGIKTIKHAESWLEMGATFVVLTWRMLKQHRAVIDLCAEYPGGVIVSLEGRNGMIAQSNGDAIAIGQLLPKYDDEGVAGVFYSELHVPGDRTDPLPIAAQIAKDSPLPVVCNGGIHAFTTATLLKEKPYTYLAGVVVGRALLTGGLNYQELLQAMRG